VTLSYIANFTSVPEDYIGKEIYKCMNAKCKFQWRGNAGPQRNCFKCGGNYIEWETFYSDWVLINNEWERKGTTDEHQRTSEDGSSNDSGTSKE